MIVRSSFSAMYIYFPFLLINFEKGVLGCNLQPLYKDHPQNPIVSKLTHAYRHPNLLSS